jgi:predicted Kef-type K+ transport protein
MDLFDFISNFGLLIGISFLSFAEFSYLFANLGGNFGLFRQPEDNTEIPNYYNLFLPR